MMSNKKKYKLIKVLEHKECDEIIEKIQDTKLWLDGKLSAGKGIKHKKNNSEIDPKSEIYSDILNKLNLAFLKNKIIDQEFLRKRIITIIINRYKNNEAYNWHFDNEYMPCAFSNEPIRTDYSFTLFLNNNYEGGYLKIEDVTVKPKKGYACFYLSNKYHSVTTVKNGYRYGIVGWIESLVKDDEIRECIVNLSKIITDTFKSNTLNENDIKKLQEIKHTIFHKYL